MSSPDLATRHSLARPSAAALTGALLVAAALLAGCGGGGHGSPTSNHTAASTSSDHAATPATSTGSGARKPRSRATATAAAGSARPVETVRPTTGKSFQTTARASPGETLILRTAFKGERTAPSVELALPGEPSARQTVTATVGGHRAAAQITSANGRPIVLTRLLYSCTLPPPGGACPVWGGPSDPGRGSRLRLRPPRGAVVELVATVARRPAGGASGAASQAAVAPYVPTELVRVQPASGGSGETPSLRRSTTAEPDQTAVIVTRVSGARGAPQTTTVQIHRGPGRTLAVSAHVAGGRTSTATLSGAGQKPIELVAPRFSCPVPPTPTFCPGRRLAGSHGVYKLAFRSTPEAPVIVLATVRSR